MADDFEFRPAPVVRADIPEGPATVESPDGPIFSEEWVKVECISCGSMGSTPKPEGLKPNPDTGVYLAVCGACAQGGNIRSAFLRNRADRRKAHRDC